MSNSPFHELGLRPSQWKAIAKKAKGIGATTPEYLRLLVERDLLADKSFDEILRPIRNDVRRSPMTEEHLDDLVSRARRASHRWSRRTRR